LPAGYGIVIANVGHRGSFAATDWLVAEASRSASFGQ
jgi:hypothetical protein